MAGNARSRVHALFVQSRSAAGRRSIMAMMREEGTVIGRFKVSRLMEELGLICKQPGRLTTSRSRSSGSISCTIVIVNSRLVRAIRSGAVTSRMSGCRVVGIIWPSYSTCSGVGLLAGRSRRARMPIWSCRRWRRPMSSVAEREACCFTQLRATNMQAGNSVSACGAIGFSRA